MADTALVYKKSTYEFYSNSPDEQVRRFVEGPDRELYISSHEAHNRSLEQMTRVMDRVVGKYDMIWRGDLKDTSSYKRIITAGGDGTAIDVAHKVFSAIELLGINTDPRKSIGHYCTGAAEDLEWILGSWERMPRTNFKRLQLSLNGERLAMQALNDVAYRHGGAFEMGRYRFSADGKEPALHRSDVLIICGVGGSTAWGNKYGAEVMPIDSDKLQYLHVGEHPVIERGYARTISIESHSREGKFAIDPPQIIMDCTLGTKVEVSVGSPITIVGDFAQKREKYVQRLAAYA